MVSLEGADIDNKVIPHSTLLKSPEEMNCVLKLQCHVVVSKYLLLYYQRALLL